MRIVTLLALYAALTGCLGWGDMLAPKRPIAGDYFLMQDEAGEGLYLFARGSAGSITGEIRRIGWNRE